MIRLVGYKKKFFDKEVLSFDKLEFESTGLYLIYGRSGSGKTTLLNSLSLLDEDFGGEYVYKKQILSSLDDEARAKFRKEYITYIHQKPVLLNDFTVFDNIKLFCNLKDAEILNYLSKFNLIDHKKSKINQLSGGERQRVALIKGLISNKPIVLADEPTGSLDEENAIFVCEELKKISKTKLVIVVSHDVELFKDYADEIIKVKGKTIEIEKKKVKIAAEPKHFSSFNTFKNKFIKRKYSRFITKKKKTKNIFITFFTSLSMICVSLIMLIGFNVKSELVNGFSKYYEPNEIVIRGKSNTVSYNKKHVPLDSEINKIKQSLDVENHRIFYSNNFETFFKDGNSLHLIGKYKTKQIDGYSARHFNEFKSKNAAKPQYFSVEPLKDDEIILSIDNPMMLDFCYFLSITKTFDSLYSYIKENDLFVSLFIKNFDWEYEDEQLFKVVGFVVESEKHIYHDDPLFSKMLFEDKMRLPATNFDEIQDRPRYIKREVVLEIDQNQKDLFYYDDFLSSFFIEKVTYKDFKTLYDEKFIKNDNLYKIYKKNTADLFSNKKINWLIEKNFPFNMETNYYLNNSLVSGFVNEIFISPSMKEIEYIEDNYLKNSYDGKISLDDKNTILSGGLLVDSKNRFSLKPTNEKYEDLGPDEVIISRKMYNFLSKSLQNSTIFLIGIQNKYLENNKIIKEYVKNELKIARIIEDDENNFLYGNQFFINSFFRDVLGLDYQKYAGSAVNLTINDDENKEIVKRYFYNYEVSEPFEEINAQINEIIFAIEIVLLVFSLIVVVISLFLLSLILKAYIIDLKEDLHVLFCNGLSKKEIGKIFKNYILKMFIKTTFVTLIFNIGMSVLISFIVSQNLNTVFRFTICWESLIALAILSILMIGIGFLMINRFIKQENVVISIRN